MLVRIYTERTSGNLQRAWEAIGTDASGLAQPINFSQVCLYLSSGGRSALAPRGTARSPEARAGRTHGTPRASAPTHLAPPASEPSFPARAHHRWWQLRLAVARRQKPVAAPADLAIPLALSARCVEQSPICRAAMRAARARSLIAAHQRLRMPSGGAVELRERPVLRPPLHRAQAWPHLLDLHSDDLHGLRWHPAS